MDVIGVDTETTGNGKDDKPFAVSMSTKDGEQWWWEWPVDKYTREPDIPKAHVREIQTRLREADLLIFHNAIFDIPMLEKIGVKFTKAMWEKVRDTLGYSHLVLSEKPHGLKPICEKYLNVSKDDEDELIRDVTTCHRFAVSQGWNVRPGKEGIRSSYWLPKLVNPKSTVLETYGLEDAYRTVNLWFFFQAIGTHVTPELLKRENDLIPIIVDMQSTGANLLPEKLDRRIRKYEKEVLDSSCSFKVVGAMNGFEDINPGSYIQVAKLLYEKLGYTDCLHQTVKNKSGYSVDEATIIRLGATREAKGLSVRGLKELLTYRKISKGLSSLKAYRKAAWKSTTHRIKNKHRTGERWTLHTQYNPWGTGTTRFTSKKENLQNVGKKAEINIREVFGPPLGKVWYALDYSQMELRILAYLSQEPALLEAFINGEDIHQRTADECDIARPLAKAVNFGIIYGGGNKLLKAMTGVDGLSTKFMIAYPCVKRFFRDNTAQARRRGWITTVYGYRLSVPHDRPYAATDYKIQGAAGDTLKYAMIGVWKYIHKHKLQKLVRMIMNIHDELVLEIDKSVDSPELARDLVKVMEKPSMELVDMYLPVDVSIIREDWAHPEETELSI